MLQSTKYAILSDVKRMSYALVGERYGMTRSAIAGLVWRHKHPPAKRIYKKYAGGYYGATNGRGWHGGGAYPAMTLRNTR